MNQKHTKYILSNNCNIIRNKFMNSEKTHDYNENNTFNCASCGYNFDRTELDQLKQCRICQSDVCTECYENRTILYFTDWLNECSNQCIGCDKIGCSECINICYQCANHGTNFDTYCINCKRFEYIDCQYHDWIICEKHQDDSCGECYVNKNYLLKH